MVQIQNSRSKREVECPISKPYKAMSSYQCQKAISAAVKKSLRQTTEIFDTCDKQQGWSAFISRVYYLSQVVWSWNVNKWDATW